MEEVNEGRLLDCGGHPAEPGRRANGPADCQHTRPKMVVQNAPQQEGCHTHCQHVRVHRIKLSDRLRSSHVCIDPVGEHYGLERLPCDDGPIRHCDCDCHSCALDPMSSDGHTRERTPSFCSLLCSLLCTAEVAMRVLYKYGKEVPVKRHRGSRDTTGERDL